MNSSLNSSYDNNFREAVKEKKAVLKPLTGKPTMKQIMLHYLSRNGATEAQVSVKTKEDRITVLQAELNQLKREIGKDGEETVVFEREAVVLGNYDLCGDCFEKAENIRRLQEIEDNKLQLFEAQDNLIQETISVISHRFNALLD